MSQNQFKKTVELRCQVIPVEKGNLLIPENLFAEVMILDGSDSTDRVSWRSRRIPLFSFAYLCGELRDEEVKKPYRAVIIRTVLQHRALPFVALATDGIPHAVTISETGIVTETAKGCPLVASYGKVGSLACMIPDLPRLEKRVLSVLIQRQKVLSAAR